MKHYILDPEEEEILKAFEEGKLIISKKTLVFQTGVPLNWKLHTSVPRYQTELRFSRKVCKLPERSGFSIRGSL